MVRRDSTVFGHGQSAVGKKRDCRQTVTNSLVAPLRRRFRAWRPMRGERLRLPGACAGRLVRRYALRGLPKLSRAQPLCIRDGRHEPSIPSSPASGSTRIRRCGFRPICSAERTGSFWSWTQQTFWTSCGYPPGIDWNGSQEIGAGNTASASTISGGSASGGTGATRSMWRSRTIIKERDMARKAHPPIHPTPDMLVRRALPAERLAALGATPGSTTGC